MTTVITNCNKYVLDAFLKYAYKLKAQFYLEAQQNNSTLLYISYNTSPNGSRLEAIVGENARVERVDVRLGNAERVDVREHVLHSERAVRRSG